HRREPHIRNFVVASQAVHDQLTQFAGLALALLRFDDERLRLIHDLFQLADGDRSFFTSTQKAVQNFLTVELLAAAVLFDHHVGNFVDPLVGREALAALQALAPAPDRLRLFTLPRVHYLVIRKSAKGTFHGVMFRSRGLTAPGCRTWLSPGPASNRAGN